MKWEILKRLLFIPAVFFVAGGMFAGEKHLERLNLKTADRQVAAVIPDLAKKPQKPLIVKYLDDTAAYGKGLIDLNTATVKKLDTLKGLGPKRAEEIVKQRQKMGRFCSVGDVMCTHGIGVKTERGFKDKVFVTHCN